MTGAEIMKHRKKMNYTTDKLQQAEKDFKHVREETESVLEGMQ